MTRIGTRVRRFLGLEAAEVAQPPEPDIEPEPEPERPDVETPAWEWNAGKEIPGDFRAKYKANGCDPCTRAELEALTACNALFGGEWFTMDELSGRIMNRDEYNSCSWSAMISRAADKGYFERVRGQRPYQYRALVEPREVRQLP